MASTEVATRNADTGFLTKFTDLDPEKIELVRRTVAPGASNDEMALFFTLAGEYGLNPFAKEIWCIKRLEDDGSPKLDKHGHEYPAQITVGRDGFLKIAEATGHFRGLVSGVVKAGDTFEMGLLEPKHEFGSSYVRMVKGADGQWQEHDVAQGRGQIIGAYAYVYRGDRDYPFRFFAEWAEYGMAKTRDRDGNRIPRARTQSPWVHYPSAMVKKVAEANALRLAFRVAGVVAEGQPDEIEVAEVIEVPDRPDDTPHGSVPAPPANESTADTEGDPDGATSPGASPPADPEQQLDLEGDAE